VDGVAVTAQNSDQLAIAITFTQTASIVRADSTVYPTFIPRLFAIIMMNKNYQFVRSIKLESREK